MLTQSQVADKIRKLLALADGAGTEAEATNAAARAAALMAQYQIQECDVDALVQDAQDPLTVVETGAADRIMGWRKLLAQGVADGCGCYALTYTRRNKGSSLVFSGRVSAVETALYMFAALSSEIERLAKRNAGGKGASFVNAYKLGMTSRIASRLRLQRDTTIEMARTAANSSALVRVSDASKQAEIHLNATLGGKVSTDRAVGCSSVGGYEAGKRDGANVNLGGGAAIGNGPRALGTGR